MTEAEIIGAGYHRKFNLSFIYGDDYEPGFQGLLYYQSLTPGSTAAAGATLTLHIGAEAPPATPSPEPTATP